VSIGQTAWEQPRHLGEHRWDRLR